MDPRDMPVGHQSERRIQEGETKYDPFVPKQTFIYQDRPKTSSSDRPKTASDGGSTDYYILPFHATELRHLISHKAMSKARGDIFKACYRLGEKDGVDAMYDLKKMQFFIEDLIEMYGRGERL